MNRRKLSQMVFNHHAHGIAHNHMQGSANCVECCGQCQITDPTQQAYTCLIRLLFDLEETDRNYWMAGKLGFRIPYRVEKFLWDHGIDVDKFRADAKGIKTA